MANRLGRVARAIERLPNTEKHRAKSEALAAHGPHGFERRGVRVELVEVGVERELLRVVARAWRDERELAIDNPLYYKNPPILVPDATGAFAEDTLEALREIVTQAIELQNREG